MQTILDNRERIAIILGAFIIAIAAAFIAHFILFKIIRKISRQFEYHLGDSFVKHCSGVIRWLFILFAVRMAIPVMTLPEGLYESISQFLALAQIAIFAAVLIKATYVFNDYVMARFDVGVRDNLKARKIHTQLNVLRRIFTAIVIFITVATMLMTFERVRALGTTLLASAGIAGIVIGMAAQKTLGTFIAGLQIAITQPIRIDDVVIVENEWGRIEEVTLTYVVVRIWDLRRLIVPITYFIEKPFQNWTRVSADLLGTVFLYVDYTVPLEPVRTEFRRLLESSNEWDKKVCVVQVTNASERTVELRALMSAGDASSLFTLRCIVREKLIEFIKDKFPASLPKVRAELDKSAAVKELAGRSA